MRFSGLTALVTGAASGIGKAVAQRFASDGATVIAIDINGEGLSDLEGDIRQVVADICDPTFASRIITENGGKVDILANVAGVMDSFLAAGEVDDATWDRVMAVNVTAPMRLMRAVLPGMVARQFGSIVNVASAAGQKGGCAGAAYTASKHALIGLSKNTAFLYAPSNVRTNVVAPGPVQTGLRPNFGSAVSAERIPALIKASITSIATPDDIATTIAWVASNEAKTLNGAVVHADGGWSAA